MKQFESFRLDTKNECLWHDGAQINLPPKPFAVLRYLVDNPGRLITHEELLDALWPETFVQPQVLRTYMLELRKVLGDDSTHPRYIQTLPKRGYCFVAPITEWHGKERNAAPENPRGDTQAAGIVGRDAELDQLTAQLLPVAHGQRRVVFVTGEAGIGKTALVDAFCRQVELSQQGTIARGQCVEGFGGKEEYYPVMEALSQLCASPDGEMACRVLARMAPAWLGALGREPAADTAAVRPAPARMPGDLCAALEELAAHQPLIVILEDLHWADEATLNLLSALARRRTAARLLVLATCARLDVATEHPAKGLKQDLLMRQLCLEIAVAPLNKTAVSGMLRNALHQEPLPSGLAGFVHQHSEGNPLFAIAMLEHLIAQRFLAREEAEGVVRWKLRGSLEEMEAGVPDGLAQMIEVEMERLRPEEQRLLEAGSLMGIAFPAWAVAAALEQDLATIEEACDALARRLYFVNHAGQDELPNGARSDFYVFAHGLYRKVLYQRQAAARRGRRHIRIAQRLCELFAGREASVGREIALHYEAAGAWVPAVQALRAAARDAQQRQAWAEGTELLERALRLTENLAEMERGAAQQEIREELLLGERPAEEMKASRKLDEFWTGT